MGHVSLAKSEAYISADNGRLTPYAPCKALASGRCTIENAIAWEKRLSEVMKDLKEARDSIKAEYEKSDPGVFTEAEESAIKKALKFASDTLLTYSRTSYASKHFTNVGGAGKAAVYLAGPAGWVLGHSTVKKHVKEMSDMIQRGAKAQDDLHELKSVVNASIEEPYTPYSPKAPLVTGKNFKYLMIASGLVIGGAVVIGGVRGYRSVTRGY